MSLALALKYLAAAKSLKLQYFCLPRAHNTALQPKISC